MRTKDTNPGTVLSYATTVNNVLQDNALTLQDYAGFNLFVNNKTVFTGVKAIDGQWHHVAVTWESSGGTWHSYKDGVKVKSSTEAFQQGEIIKGGGVLILGQEQDELGGGFRCKYLTTSCLLQTFIIWHTVVIMSKEMLHLGVTSENS